MTPGHALLLQESATLRPAAAAVLQEVRRIANVYVIAHVADDIGEATVRGALEAGMAQQWPLCVVHAFMTECLHASPAGTESM